MQCRILKQHGIKWQHLRIDLVRSTCNGIPRTIHLFLLFPSYPSLWFTTPLFLPPLFTSFQSLNVSSADLAVFFPPVFSLTSPSSFVCFLFLSLPSWLSFFKIYLYSGKCIFVLKIPLPLASMLTLLAVHYSYSQICLLFSISRPLTFTPSLSPFPSAPPRSGFSLTCFLS